MVANEWQYEKLSAMISGGFNQETFIKYTAVPCFYFFVRPLCLLSQPFVFQTAMFRCALPPFVIRFVFLRNPVFADVYPGTGKDT